ncbi:MAG: hypothetical protein Q7U96_04595, partial [Chloroflexota bacterium]|nr:hypothetical protein [Chloroflexota bacterium]
GARIATITTSAVMTKPITARRFRTKRTGKSQMPRARAWGMLFAGFCFEKVIPVNSCQSL